MDLPYKWYLVTNKFSHYLLRTLPASFTNSGGYLICKGRGYVLDKCLPKDFTEGFAIPKDLPGPFNFMVGRVTKAVEVTVRENSGDSTTTA
jgi:hypothetical protein